MRIYGGLQQPYDPERVAPDRLSGADFTDCPYTALVYATGRRSVVLVLDVPQEAEDSAHLSEERWLGRKATRLELAEPGEGKP